MRYNRDLLRSPRAVDRHDVKLWLVVILLAYPIGFVIAIAASF